VLQTLRLRESVLREWLGTGFLSRARSANSKFFD
jgi:hypothetical protein